MAITKIPAAGFTGNNFKNIIINGDMSIAQRSTSVAGISSSGYYTVDRYLFEIGAAGTWTQTQDTDVPSGQGFANSIKLACTTADASLGSGDICHLHQRIEGQNLQYIKKGTANAESLTLSFWVKSNKTGTYIAEFRERDNNRTISKSYTISVADTWEKKTLTFAGDTSGVLGNDNGNSLQINFWLAAGANYSSGTLQTSWGTLVAANRAVGQVNLADSTSNYINITGVQLEAGTSASDFEFLPVDVNLRRCLRYYWRTDNNLAKTGYYAFFGGAGGVYLERVPFPVPMRSSPSYTHGNGSNNNQSLRQGSTPSNFTIQSNEGNSNQGLNMTIYNGGGGLSWTEGQAFSCLIYNLQCNAEL